MLRLPADAEATDARVGTRERIVPARCCPQSGADGRSIAVSGFEDHSVSVIGDDQIVTYDDSNVFVARNGQINANTGDTDSSGLNAVDVIGSRVRSGNSGDGEGRRGRGRGRGDSQPRGARRKLRPTAKFSRR